MQFVKFGIVGVSNTVISYVLYAVSLIGVSKGRGVFTVKVDYLVAQVIAFVLSCVMVGFTWNEQSWYLFLVRRKTSVQYGKTLLKNICFVFFY